MAQTEYREVLAVDPEKLFAVIIQYDDYPQFVEGCTYAHSEPQANGVVRVKYRVQLMSQDVTYTLDHQANPEAGQIGWTLVESNFFKKNTGCWALKSLGQGKSEVIYSLDIEFKVPVPGFILKRLIQGSLPGMVKSFEKQANRTSSLKSLGS